jgi:hypothetical protein
MRASPLPLVVVSYFFSREEYAKIAGDKNGPPRMEASRDSQAVTGCGGHRGFSPGPIVALLLGNPKSILVLLDGAIHQGQGDRSGTALGLQAVRRGCATSRAWRGAGADPVDSLDEPVPSAVTRAPKRRPIPILACRLKATHAPRRGVLRLRSNLKPSWPLSEKEQTYQGREANP